MRMAVSPPQSIADEHTLIAQKYAGWFLGHPYRAAQQRTGPEAIQVEWTHDWKEPNVVADDCQFCRRLTDDEADRRVTGYQHAIDIEVLRSHSTAYAEWLATADGDVPDIEEVLIAGVAVRRGVANSAENRRRYIELHERRFDINALPLVDMPLRLKRKLCIEWNHLYLAWMRDNPETWYDPDAREFYREVEDPQDVQAEQLKAWWGDVTPFAGGVA